MLHNKHGMLLPDDTPDSLSEFLHSIIRPDDSENRFVIILEQPLRDYAKYPHYAEGYIGTDVRGGVYTRPNVISRTKPLPLNDWGHVVAIFGSNKHTQEFWLHDDIDSILKEANDTRRWYSFYITRIRECQKKQT